MSDARDETKSAGQIFDQISDKSIVVVVVIGDDSELQLYSNARSDWEMFGMLHGALNSKDAPEEPTEEDIAAGTSA